MLKKPMAAIIVITGLVGGLMACSPLPEVAKKNDIAVYKGFNSKGEPIFLNPKTGEAIAACDARKENNQCKTEIRNNDGTPTLYYTGTDKPVPGAIMVQTTTFVWKGSHCQTDVVGGKGFENCWPW